MINGVHGSANVPVLDRERLRELDRRAVAEFGISSLVLMENAARSACETLLAYDPVGPIVIVCGRGNNAGDGFALARLLDSVGLSVRLALLDAPEAFSTDAAANFEIARRCALPIVSCLPFARESFINALNGADWIVDAVLGTGARGEPREPYAAAIALMNEANSRRFALDLPSGLDCDRGLISPITFRAEVTIAFAALKPGFADSKAAEYLGRIHLGSIGAPRLLVEELLRR